MDSPFSNKYLVNDGDIDRGGEEGDETERDLEFNESLAILAEDTSTSPVSFSETPENFSRGSSCSTLYSTYPSSPKLCRKPKSSLTKTGQEAISKYSGSTLSYDDLLRDDFEFPEDIRNSRNFVHNFLIVSTIN
jgi:hypothetical protein